MSADIRERETRPGKIVLGLMLFAGLGSPLAWAFHLFVSYAYVPAVCAGWPHWGLHTLTAVAIVWLVAVGVTSAAFWFGRVPIVGSDIRGARYVGLFGLVLSIYFLGVVLMHAWPNFVTDACVGLGDA